ncbi:UNVERIFIED_CONTAM: hypothetical protein HHA_243110 [Hammondia hammondi]|eukprot:XP_008884385.1 hypothetical protein HHA_243110 [Hammondia hammondi]
MKRQALRAVLLTFLVATVVPCTASDANEPESEPDFIVTIGSRGVEENSQQVFFLGPSATLRVVDEGNKAVLLPEPSTTDGDNTPQFRVAYVFENGSCNFTKTLAYRDAFRGYSRPLWVRSSAHVGRGEEVPAGTVANYTFTSPPADSMSGGVSFCVRFTTSAAATTSTTTKSPTTPADSTTTSSESTECSSTGPTVSSGSTSPSGGGSDSSSESGEGEGSGDGSAGDGSSSTDPSRPQQPLPELQPPTQGQPDSQQQPPVAPQTPAPPKSPASSRPEEKIPPKLPDDGLKGEEGEDPGEAGEEGVQGEPTHSGASQDETGAREKQDELHPVPAGSALNEPSSSIVDSPQAQNTSPNINTEAAEQENSTASSVEKEQKEHQPLQPLDEPAVQAKPIENPDQDIASDDAPTRLRRLSDVETSAAKYLTIVVHSAAGRFSPTTLSLSAAAMSVAMILLSNI